VIGEHICKHTQTHTHAHTHTHTHTHRVNVLISSLSVPHLGRDVGKKTGRNRIS
jgi:hypothetical protein